MARKREARDALVEGRIETVAKEPRRLALAGDHAAGATTLTVDVTRAPFTETGGQVMVNDVTYIYTAYDDDAGTLTLTTGLAAAADDGDWVNEYDPLYGTIVTDLTALVRLPGGEDNDDALHATFAQHLVDKIGEDIRGLPGEQCLMDRDHDVWRIVDILGLSDADSGPGGGPKWEADDTYVLTADDIAAGTATVPLTFKPITESLVAVLGIAQRPSNYTIDYAAKAITWPLDGWEAAGDRIWVHYAYRVGTIGPSDWERDWASSGWRILTVVEGDAVDRSDVGFDDSSWTVASAPAGYPLDPVSGQSWPVAATSTGTENAGVWMRAELVVPNNVSSIKLRARVDGQWWLYLDGVVVASDAAAVGATEVGPYTVSVASGSHTVALHVNDDAADPAGDFLYADVKVSAS